MTSGPIMLGPAEGRAYAMPDMHAVFKADGEETGERYSVSEWWVKPHGKGPGPHLHATEDELFYVIAGTMSVMVADAWRDLAAGSFIRIPAGTMHDFENRTTEPAALLNVFMGVFEHNMPAIVKWYEEHR